MKSALIVLNAVVAFSFFATAQSAEEALRYSELRFGGSARGIGVAGAFGAMGADYSSILSNPGGLALYRKSEVMFTLGFDQTNVETFYDGSRAEDDRFIVNVPNLGGVFAGKIKKNTKWKFANFGIGYNRLANFHTNSYYRSNNTYNSILTSYAQELQGVPSSDISYYGGDYSLESVLAYDAYLVNPVSNNSYVPVTLNTKVNQQISIERRGALDELSLAVAANYDDKIYFGGYLGIPFISYRERSRHAEQNTTSDSDDFNYFEQHKALNTSGAGVNFKMGVIARPIDWLRVGAAFHTPTFYGIDDDYTYSMMSDFDTISHFPPEQFGEFHYNLVTPMRFVGSIGLVARKYAFVSFDYEWVDYSNAKYKMDSPFTEFEVNVNDDIGRLYGSANIYRAGAEFALDKFRIRGGFAHYDSPYKNNELVGDYDSSVNYFSVGTGIRFKRAYLDLAYVRSRSKAINLKVDDVLAKDEITGNRFVVTTGFRF